jgi:ABC-type transport system involved in cytochrome c biogenesis permease subunit
MAADRGAGVTAEHHPAYEEGVLRPDSPLNLLPLGLYAAAFVVYAIHFAKRQPSAGRAATTLLLLGVLAHTFVIGMQTMEVRHVPYSNTSTAVSSFVWMLALSYLYLEVTTDERAMGVFIVPILVGLQTIPAINPGVDYRDPVLDSPWFWVHVTSLLFAYATFALAAMLGLTYVLQFKEIKKKHLGYFYTRLPSLHVLDAMNSRAVIVGWLFLTVGVVVGIVWTAQALAQSPENLNLQAISLQDPKVFIAVLTWAVYSFAMVARKTLGWTGRRAAWLSALGFVIVLLNFLPVSYFVTTSHTFQ